jgi:tetratricopeptide (TPR) repeat protein
MQEYIIQLMMVGTENYSEDPSQIEAPPSKEVVEFFSSKKDAKLRHEQIVEQGKSWRDKVSGIDDRSLFAHYKYELSEEELCTLYTKGVKDYQAGLLKNALAVFRFVFMVNPLNYDFSFALANTLFHMKHYLLAADTFRIAAANDPRKVAPYYLIGESYLEAGCPFLSMQAWEYVIYHGGESLEGKEQIVTRSKLQFDHWLEFMKKQAGITEKDVVKQPVRG